MTMMWMTWTAVLTALLATPVTAQILVEETPGAKPDSSDVGQTLKSTTRSTVTPTTNSIAKPPTSKPLTPRQYSDQAGVVLRNHARATSLNDQVAESLRIVDLFQQLVRDPRLATSSSMRDTASRLRGRLNSIKRETAAAERRRKRRPARIEIRQDVLAQLNQAANNGNAPAQNNLQPQDYGQQLVDLIQRTVSPASWDVNGGLSTIRYWRPGMALVVRAPQGVHEELTPLMGQLRRE